MCMIRNIVNVIHTTDIVLRDRDLCKRAGRPNDLAKEIPARDEIVL